MLSVFATGVCSFKESGIMFISSSSPLKSGSGDPLSASGDMISLFPGITKCDLQAADSLRLHSPPHTHYTGRTVGASQEHGSHTLLWRDNTLDSTWRTRSIPPPQDPRFLGVAIGIQLLRCGLPLQAAAQSNPRLRFCAMQARIQWSDYASSWAYIKTSEITRAPKPLTRYAV